MLTRYVYPDFAFSNRVFTINSIIMLAAIFVLRLLFGCYYNVWRYTSTIAYLKLMWADIIGSVIAVVIMKLFHLYSGMWHPIMVPALTLILVILARYTYRQIYKRLNTSTVKLDKNNPVAIIGTGQAGVDLVRYLRNSRNLKYSPKFFIDSDRTKVGNRASGLPVFAGTMMDPTL